MPAARDVLIGLSLLATVMVWGSAFSAIKILLDRMSAVDAVVVRFLFVAVGYLLIWWLHRPRWRRRWPPDAGSARRLLVLGLLGVPGYHVALNVGEGMLADTASRDVAAGLTSLLIATTPIFTMLLAAVFLRERITLRRAAGILIAFAGVAVLVVWGRGVRMAPDAMLGALVVLAAPLSWAAYSILVKKELKRRDHLSITTYSMLAGSLAMVPAIDYGFLGRVQSLDAVAWWWAAWLGVVATIGGYTVWNWALTHWDATRVTAFVYLVPLFALTWAVVLVGERVTVQLLLGGALVLLGVWLTTPRGRRATPAPASASQAPSAAR